MEWCIGDKHQKVKTVKTKLVNRAELNPEPSSTTMDMLYSGRNNQNCGSCKKRLYITYSNYLYWDFHVAKMGQVCIWFCDYKCWEEWLLDLSKQSHPLQKQKKRIMPMSSSKLMGNKNLQYQMTIDCDKSIL